MVKTFTFSLSSLSWGCANHLEIGGQLSDEKQHCVAEMASQKTKARGKAQWSVSNL